MSAKNSGINLVVEVAPTYLNQLVANRLAYASLMPPATLGYRRYCVTKAGAATLRTYRSLPVLDVPIRLQGEDATGRFFDRDDLSITFQIAAIVEDTNIDLRLDYHSLSAIREHLDEALSGSRLQWSVPLDFLSVLDASVEPLSATAKIAGGALAIGVEAEGGETADTARFERFRTNFLGPSDALSISIERELMEILLDAVVDDVVRQETAGERVLDAGYFVSRASFTWEADHVRIVLQGVYHYDYPPMGDRWSCEVTSRGNFFIDNVGRANSRLRATFAAHIPDDARLTGDDAWADGIFHREAPPADYTLTTFDDWSPAARFPLEPEEMEAHAQALEALEHTAQDLTLHFAAEVLEVSGAGRVAADPDELSTAFTRHFLAASPSWPCGNPPGPGCRMGRVKTSILNGWHLPSPTPERFR